MSTKLHESFADGGTDGSHFSGGGYSPGRDDGVESEDDGAHVEAAAEEVEEVAVEEEAADIKAPFDDGEEDVSSQPLDCWLSTPQTKHRTCRLEAVQTLVKDAMLRLWENLE